MTTSTLQERVDALEREVRQLRRRLLGCAVLAAALTAAAFTANPDTVRFAQVQADTIRVNNLIVADPNGTDRVRIAAPLPDPIMLGRRFNRGESVSGVLLFDSEGMLRYTQELNPRLKFETLRSATAAQ